MSRRTKRQIMAGVNCTSSSIVDHNTVEYERENGDRVIRLHLTDIVTFRPDGTIMLNSGGWKTITTKTRMNNQISPWDERRTARALELVTVKPAANLLDDCYIRYWVTPVDETRPR